MVPLSDVLRVRAARLDAVHHTREDAEEHAKRLLGGGGAWLSCRAWIGCLGLRAFRGFL